MIVTSSNENLPDFDRPPVVETVLGVQFEPLEKLTNAHLGSFWTQVKEQWPHVQHAPLLRNQFERFEELHASWLSTDFQIEVTQDPSCRVMLQSAGKDKMVQIQKSRFHYNWLGGYQGHGYPKYDVVRPAFDETYKQFLTFIAAESLGVISPNQWEVTYLNHIPKGTVWSSPEDWRTVLNGLPLLGSAGNYITLENLQGEWHFEITPKRGRLHVQLMTGTRNAPDSTKRELLILKLTARGPIDRYTSLNDGLDIGHETIVKSFREFTSETARDYWGEKRAATRSQ